MIDFKITLLKYSLFIYNFNFYYVIKLIEFFIFLIKNLKLFLKKIFTLFI